MPHCLLPLIRVHSMPGGRLVRNHRESGLPPVDEQWWLDVLFDPRAQLPRERDIPARSPNAGYRLDRQRGSTIEAECTCGHRPQFPLDKAMLLRELRPATNVIWRSANMCRATLVLSGSGRVFDVPRTGAKRRTQYAHLGAALVVSRSSEPWSASSEAASA